MSFFSLTIENNVIIKVKCHKQIERKFKNVIKLKAFFADIFF